MATRQQQESALIRLMKESRQGLGKKKSAIFKPDLDIQVYKPQNGDHVIDIIQYRAGQYMKPEYRGEYVHTFPYLSHRLGVNKTEVICPRQFGLPCPMCDLLDSMNYDDNIDFFKEYGQKKRNLYNVVVLSSRDEKSKGVQVLDQPEFFMEENLIGAAFQKSVDGGPDKWIEFAHPKRGKSVQISIKSGSKFPQWRVTGFRDRHYDIGKDILDQCYILDEIVIFKTYDEIKEIMDGGVAGGSYTGQQATQKTSGFNPEDIKSKVLFDIDSLDELEDIINFYELDEKGFQPIDFNKSFEGERDRLISFLGSLNSDNSGSSQPDHYKTQGGTLHIDHKSFTEKLRLINDHFALDQLVDGYGLTDYGFEAIDSDKPFLEEKKRFRNWIKDRIDDSQTGKPNDDNQSENRDIDTSTPTDRKPTETFDPEKAIAELKNLKVHSQLEEIAVKYGLAFDINHNEKFIKEKVRLRKYLQSLEQPELKAITIESLNKLNYSELIALINDRFSDVLFSDDYDSETDVDTMREDILAASDDIPF